MYSNELMKSTLVPMDFSENSMVALEHAIALRSALSKENIVITLLHVIEGGSFNAVTEDSMIDAGGRDALAIEGALNRLKKIVEAHQKEGSAFRYIVASGKPYRRIAEIARDINANIIVMGTHGSSGIQALAGSNASKVIQGAPCPVVVIKERPFTKGYKNIVLPLDLTKETKQKVGFAAVIAKYFDATIHIITMYESDEFLAKRLKNNMHQVERFLRDNSVKYTSTLLEEKGGDFGRQTITWAQGKDADLIVIMTQQERDLAEYIFGSYAQQIVNRSPIPVMAITPRPELEGDIPNLLT